MRPGSGDSTSNDVNIKYVCPPKRKIQGSKIIRSSGSSSPSHQQLASKVSPSNYVSHPGSTGHTSVHNSRERINGVESGQPKPQRSILNTRHGNFFVGRYGNNEINPRFSGNGNLNTQPTAQVNENKSSTAHSQSNIYTSTAPSNTTETASQRKPPLPNQQHSIDHQNTNIQRKLSRGREEQLTELKKFASEFKLSEACEETNKCNNENGDEDNNVVDTTSSGETPSSTSRPSTGGGPSEVDRITAKSTLNPNAKEFIYNPNSKPFTPRSPSTPTQSRPHTPQTPGYGAPPVPSIPMVMPTYVVTTAQPPPYSQPPNQQNRYRKVQMGISQRPDLASQMQVAAATGQPLLAPAPMHTQFTVPYTPQAHIAPQPYQQMVRMVAQQSSGMVPLVPAAINYPPESAAQAQLQYMAPHPHHPHHAPHHPANNPTASPQANTNGHQGQMNAGASGGGTGTGGGGGNNNSAPPPYHHTPQSPATTYTQPPPPSSANASTGPPNPQTHTYPLMCPIIPAPPPPPHPATHNPHHMMAAAAAAQNSVQFIHHHHPAQGIYL
ncbi:hypothetical protein AAG570_012909 [Ranatra chinensis]|uniref:Uncharacterized protein n=1 Tax=Ranatra chinensis TaxID=642074 RepID=A0ABD0YF95_9HEMI